MMVQPFSTDSDCLIQHISLSVGLSECCKNQGRGFACQNLLVPGDLVISLGDAHLYSNHLDQAREQLMRAPRPLPEVRIDPGVKQIDDFRYEHFKLEGYEPHPHIAAPVAV